MRTAVNQDARQLIGVDEEIRKSDWLQISQDRIDEFSHATNDPDRFHIDPDFAREFSPFGTTISFGFLTVSLLTSFYNECFDERAHSVGLNYGFNKLRLPAPVPVGARIRGVFKLIGREERGDGKMLLTYDVTIEIEGSDRPALVAEWLAMLVEDGVQRPSHLAVR